MRDSKTLDVKASCIVHLKKIVNEKFNIKSQIKSSTAAEDHKKAYFSASVQHRVPSQTNEFLH